jgi:hypothetical protein
MGSEEGVDHIVTCWNYSTSMIYLLVDYCVLVPSKYLSIQKSGTFPLVCLEHNMSIYSRLCDLEKWYADMVYPFVNTSQSSSYCILQLVACKINNLDGLYLSLPPNVWLASTTKSTHWSVYGLVLLKIIICLILWLFSHNSIVFTLYRYYSIKCTHYVFICGQLTEANVWYRIYLFI